MKTLLFKIIQRQKMDVFLTLPEIQRFPTHEMHFNKLSEKIISVNYKAPSTFKKEEFTAFMCRRLKKHFRAHSVEVLEPILRLEKTSEKSI